MHETTWHRHDKLLPFVLRKSVQLAYVSHKSMRALGFMYRVRKANWDNCIMAITLLRTSSVRPLVNQLLWFPCRFAIGSESTICVKALEWVLYGKFWRSSWARQNLYLMSNSLWKKAERKFLLHPQKRNVRISDPPHLQRNRDRRKLATLAHVVISGVGISRDHDRIVFCYYGFVLHHGVWGILESRGATTSHTPQEVWRGTWRPLLKSRTCLRNSSPRPACQASGPAGTRRWPAVVATLRSARYLFVMIDLDGVCRVQARLDWFESHNPVREVEPRVSGSFLHVTNVQLSNHSTFLERQRTKPVQVVRAHERSSACTESVENKRERKDKWKGRNESEGEEQHLHTCSLQEKDDVTRWTGCTLRRAHSLEHCTNVHKWWPSHSRLHDWGEYLHYITSWGFERRTARTSVESNREKANRTWIPTESESVAWMESKGRSRIESNQQWLKSCIFASFAILFDVISLGRTHSHPVGCRLEELFYWHCHRMDGFFLGQSVPAVDNMSSQAPCITDRYTEPRRHWGSLVFTTMGTKT